MSLTPMVNVDPFDFSKYHEDINQDVPFDLSTHHLPGAGRDGAPAFTLQILPEYDQENGGQSSFSREVTSSSGSAGHKHPLTENRTNIISHLPPPDPEKTQDSVAKLSRKKYFKDEKLVLDCEWDDCDESFSLVTEFVEHVSRHVTEAEVRGPGAEADTEEVFGCLWSECGFESPSSEEMVRHINFHSFHTKIKCHGYNMVTGQGLAPCSLDPGQRNIVPELAEPWLCQWAGCEEAHAQTGFSRPQHFYSHVTSHAEETRGKGIACKWASCTSKAGSVSKLKEHMRAHTGEKMIGCPTCGALFSNRVKFLDHCKRQQISNEDSFKCNNCGKQFALERLLRDHMRSHINHYKCPHCDMTCPTPSTLTRHIKYKHMDEKPFQCNFCDFTGKTQSCIKGHMKIHIEESVYKCEEPGCDFICRAQVTLKKHFLKKHEKSSVNNYACHLCDKRYDRGAFLTKHLMKNHNFSWPSGHSRFRYIRDEVTGFYRLQTIRFESLDLQDEIQGSDSLRIADSEADPSESVRSVSPGLYRTSSPVSSITDLSSWPGGGGSQRLADLPDDRGSWSQRVPESEAGSSWAGGSQRLTEDSLEAGSWSQRIPEETEAMETEAELEDTAHQVLSSLLARHEAEQYIVKY